MSDPAREATGKLGAYGYGAGTPGDRGIADIIKDIIGNIQNIIRSEVRLATVELKEEGKKAATASTMLGTAAVMGLFGFGFICLTAMFLLAMVVAVWLAALIVAILLLVGAGIAFSVGRERLRKVGPPKATIRTLQEDAEWMKEQARS